MFNKPSISDYYRAVLAHVEKSLLTADSSYILNTDTQDIIAKYSSEHLLSPIVFDKEKKETMRHRKEMRNVPANSRDSFYHNDGAREFEYEIIDVSIPILSNSTILQTKDFQTSTYSFSWSPSDFNWDSNGVTFSVVIKGYGFKHDDDQVVKDIEECKRRVNEWVGWVNNDIQKENELLMRNLAPTIENRKKKLGDDKGRIGGLSDKLGISLE